MDAELSRHPSVRVPDGGAWHGEAGPRQQAFARCVRSRVSVEPPRSMRIGLVRHFPVVHGMPQGWMTAAQLHAWRLSYDASAVRTGPIDAGGPGWVRCFSSDLDRAYVTARAFFSGEITRTPLLREPDLAPFRTGPLSLPHAAWRWVLRFAWMSGHSSQRAARDDFLRRVRAVADLLDGGTEDTLVVSHAGMMAYLSRDLHRRGFRGPKLRLAEHARLYVFERAQKPRPAEPAAATAAPSARSA